MTWTCLACCDEFEGDPPKDGVCEECTENSEYDEGAPDPEEEEPEPWDCSVCEGSVESMGMLGNTEHGNCRGCGMQQCRSPND